MELKDKVIVVTGAGNGIGRALCERFAVEKPRGIVLADLDEAALRDAAESIGGKSFTCDVRSEPSIVNLIDYAESTFGPIDLFCSNAGVASPGGPEVSNESWLDVLDVNFMSHVYATRNLLPKMVERKGGYLLHTSSAAGLLSEISSATYAVTKHAVVALAEWISINYGDRGIRVSCLCPQGVRTQMLSGDSPAVKMLRESSISVEAVAESVIEGIRAEEFLILPHPEVADFFRRKADDYDRWLRGMRRLRENFGIG